MDIEIGENISFKIMDKIIHGTVLSISSNRIIIVSVENNQIHINPSMIVRLTKRRYNIAARKKKMEIDKVPLLYFKHTKLESIDKLKNEKCCEKVCLKNINNEDLLKERIKFLSLGNKEKIKWVSTFKFISRNNFHFNGISVCSMAFKKIYCITNDLYSKASKSEDSVHHNLDDVHKEGDNVTFFKAWMMNFMKNFCESCPNSSFHIVPFIFDWKAIYEMYHEQSSFKFNYDRFVRLRKQHFPMIKLLKYTSHSKCNICIDLRHQKILLRGSFHGQKISDELEMHYKLIKEERLAYYSRIIQSTLESESLSIVIDGMTSIGIPSRFPIPKSHSTVSPIKITPYGVICHTLKKRMIIFLPPNQSSNSNIVISIIWSYLVEFYCNYKKFPKHINIQSDNAVKELKNRFILGFFSIIINLNYIESVNISMLPVGHTHVDIDQMFSILSKKLRKSNIECLSKLIQISQSAFNKEETKPEIRLLFQCWDIKKWINEKLQPFKGIKSFSSFSIRKSEDNNYPVVFYKKFSTDSDWIGSFEAIRFVPQNPPDTYKYFIKIENEGVLKSLPFLDKDHYKEFCNLLDSPSNYGKIYNDYYEEFYNETFSNLLNNPFILRHFFPVIDYNQDHEMNNSDHTEVITDIISFPRVSKKIMKLKIEEKKFFITQPLYATEDHYQLIKIKNIPINELSATTWVDIIVYNRWDNQQYKKIERNQIIISKIVAKIDNIKKIAKGVYYISLRSHQRFNHTILNNKF